MTDSRWLQELTNSYINKSAGLPSNINEELINEQAEYISELEDIVISIAEALEVSVEDLMEYHVSDKDRNTPRGEALAKRYAARVKALIVGRNDKLQSDGDAMGSARHTMAQGNDDSRLGTRLHTAATAAGVPTHFNQDPTYPGYIKRLGDYSAIGKDTPLNISKVPEADRDMANREGKVMGDADRANRRDVAAKAKAAIEKKRAERAHADKWTV